MSRTRQSHPWIQASGPTNQQPSAKELPRAGPHPLQYAPAGVSYAPKSRHTLRSAGRCVGSRNGGPPLVHFIIRSTVARGGNLSFVAPPCSLAEAKPLALPRSWRPPSYATSVRQSVFLLRPAPEIFYQGYKCANFNSKTKRRSSTKLTASN